MTIDIRCYVCQESATAQLWALIAVEDAIAEYLILRRLDSSSQLTCISHRIYRMKAEDDDEGSAVLDTSWIADGLVRDLAKHDRWARDHLPAATHFDEMANGLDQLKAHVGATSSADDRLQVMRALEAMRGRARTLDLKRFLDMLLGQLEVQTRPSLSVG